MKQRQNKQGWKKNLQNNYIFNFTQLKGDAIFKKLKTNFKNPWNKLKK